MSNITWLDEDTPSRKRAKVTYECCALNGERKRKSKTFKAGTPLREIKAFQRKVEQEYESSEGMDYSKRLLKNFLKEYFEMYGQFLSPTTLQGYTTMAYGKGHGIVHSMGNVELTKLSTTIVQKYVDFLMDDGLSPKSIRNYVSMLHAVYDKAMKLHYVQQNYNIVSKVEVPKVRRKKVESYSVEEIKKLLELADNYADDELRLEIYLAIGTGARRSEMAAIQISSIDFKNKVWHVEESKVHAGLKDVVKAPKTDAGLRDIPLSDTLCRELKRAVKRYKKKKMRGGADFEDSGYLFSNEMGKPYRTNTLTNRYVRFMRAHSDEIRYLPLHCAGRHSYASIAIANGIDIKCLQEILGHSDSSTTLNTYANSYVEQKQEYANNMDEIIFKKKA